VMDYSCAMFGDFGLSRFGVIVLIDRLQTESQRRMIAGVSNNAWKKNSVIPRIILAGDSGGNQKMTSVRNESRRHGITRMYV